MIVWPSGLRRAVQASCNVQWTAIRWRVIQSLGVKHPDRVPAHLIAALLTLRNLRVRKGAGSNPAAISIAFCLRNAKKRLKNDVRKAVGGWRKLYFLFGAAAAAGGGGAWHASCAYMPIDRAHRVVADLHRPDLGRTSPSLPLLAATRNRFPFCIFTVWKLMWRTLVRRGSTQLVPGGCPHAVYFLCSASPLFSPSPAPPFAASPHHRALHAIISCPIQRG